MTHSQCLKLPSEVISYIYIYNYIYMYLSLSRFLFLYAFVEVRKNLGISVLIPSGSGCSAGVPAWTSSSKRAKALALWSSKHGWLVGWLVLGRSAVQTEINTLICCLHILHSPGGTPIFTQLSRCLEVLGPTGKNIEDANIHQIWVHVSQYPSTLVNPKQLVNWCSPPKKWNLPGSIR